MTEEMMANVSEIMGFSAETWKGVAIAAGHTSGLFDILKCDSSITIEDLAKRKEYNVEKVRKWIYFAEGVGLVTVKNNAVTLTSKGELMSSASPLRDVLAFVDETAYFIKAAASAETTFKSNQSLDKLSDGRISKDYQPKVSDNLSIVLINYLKKYGISEGDTFLDVGCGNGSFLRGLYKAMPSLHFSGVDINLFAIEKAKKEHISLGLADKIKMIVGDILEDMDEFPDNSYDWLSAINVLHFVPENKRDALISNMHRISRKGVFFNTVEVETSMIDMAGNTLLSLLWNDYAGFYTKAAAEQLFDELPKKYKDCDVQVASIIQGHSKLVTMIKN